MICYPEDATEAEITVINDYWLVSDKSLTGFLYTVGQITNYYRDKNLRHVMSLTRGSRFYLPSSAFICQDCDRKTPVENRKEYAERIKVENPIICSECSAVKRQRAIEDAHRILRDFQVEKVKPVPCLDSLTVDETLVLLSISSEKSGDSNFLGWSPAEVSVTGAQLVDDNFLYGLIEKKALIYISEIPLDVESANTVIHGETGRIRYDNESNATIGYRRLNCINRGLYLNHQTAAGHVEISEFSSILYQKLRSATWSVDDVEKMYQIIKEAQVAKIYKLVLEISREFNFKIDNSNTLRALLSHLAENYRPQNLYFTFNVKVQQAIVYANKVGAPEYKAKNFFAKFVGDYISYVESKGFELKKTWTFPPHMQTSSFEAIFSQLYLGGYFNWDRLSAKEIIALWLENINLSENVQGSLPRTGQDNSMIK